MLYYSSLCDIFFVRVFYFVVRLQFSYSKFGLGNIPLTERFSRTHLCDRNSNTRTSIFVQDVSLISKHRCARRRRTYRTHTNRVVFTEITLEGFMDQSQGDRSWCHAISSFGCHFGLAGWMAMWHKSLDLMCKCFLGRLELKTTIFFPAQSVQ